MYLSRTFAAGLISFLLFQTGLAGFVWLISSQSAEALEAARDVEAFRGWMLYALYFLVLAPLTEEFSFRGWVQGWLEPRFSVRIAILVSAVLFGLAHSLGAGRLIFAPGAILLGAICGGAVYVSGSLWAAVLLHALANCLAILLRRLIMTAPSVLVSHGSVLMLVFLCLAILGAVGLLMAGKAVFAESAGSGF